MTEVHLAKKASRWKCVVAYDGTAFAGWQSQPKANAIQDKLEARLQEIFGHEIRIHGSGRTDSGVHALAQVFHFDAYWPHAAAKLLSAFRVGLPPTIQVKSARRVAADFHARFDATGKIYRYHLFQGYADPFETLYSWSVVGRLDLAAMRSAAKCLVGKHDFRAFTALNGTDQEDTVRTLRRLDILEIGRKLTLTFEADGFLYKMVRSLTGALVAVGKGKLSASRMPDILNSRTRTSLVFTSPPHGLFLVRVFY